MSEEEKLRKRIEKLESLLREIEYINLADTFGDGLINELTDSYFEKWRFCPACGYKEPDGHWRDCPIAEALGKL